MNLGVLVAVVKWQTRQLEGLVPERAWGFKSPLRYWLFVKEV